MQQREASSQNGDNLTHLAGTILGPSPLDPIEDIQTYTFLEREKVV